MEKAEKKKVSKKVAKLAYLPGCMGCGKMCKYNTEIADPMAASEYSYNEPYGCNTRLQGFTIEEGVVNERGRRSS